MPSSWTNEWNNIIRHTLFQDTELKTLMKIPEGTTIIDFIDNQFVRTGQAGVLLTNQSVRIIYGVINSSDTNNPGVSRDTISFDIYVKNDDQHNVCTDRLVQRNQVIAERLRSLLMNRENTYGYKFYEPKETDLGTSMIGQTRFNISFKFMRTH